MKNSIKRLSIGLVALALSLGSCSRQTASLQTVNKLADAQTLQSAPAPKPESEKQILPKINVDAPLAEVNQNPVQLSNDNSKTLPVSKKIAQTSKKESRLVERAAKTIVKQANSVLSPGINNHMASYTRTNHTQGWIGLAITCLIVAIILFAFGFGFAAVILWEIGIIILGVALVFFVLWLLASAAGA